MGRPRIRPTFIPVTFALWCLATLATTQGTECPRDISTSSAATWSISEGTTCDAVSGSDFPIGVTTVNCILLNSDESTTTCTFRVIIIDDEEPKITKCPPSRRLPLPDFSPRSGPGEAATAATWDSPAASDNSGSEWFAEPSPTHRSGSLFPLGSTHVVYTARDYSGNVNTDCNFDVQVVVQPPQNHTFVSEFSTESITVLFPQLGDSVKDYYILQYQDKSTRDESFTSRTSFTVTDNDDTFIEQIVEENLSPGQLYFLEVGTDESGSQGIISTVQQWTKPATDSQIVVSSAYTSVMITFTPSTSSVEQYKVGLNTTDINPPATLYQRYHRNDTEEVVIDGLVPGSSYITYVSAVVGSGELRVESVYYSIGVSSLDDLNEDQFIAYNYTESTIGVAWRRIGDGVSENEPYMLFIYTDEEEKQPSERFLPVFAMDPNQVTLTAEFKGLLPETVYHVRLISNAGLSLHLSQRTRPMRVSNLRATEVLDNSIRLEWDPVSHEANAGVTYEVTISPKPGSDYELTTASNTRTVASLVKGTEYFFTVASILNGTKSVVRTLTVTAGVNVVSPPLNTKAIIIGVVLSLVNMGLAIVLFIMCRKYRNLKATPGTTGHTNDPMTPMNKYAGQHYGGDVDDTYEIPEAMPRPDHKPDPKPKPLKPKPEQTTSASEYINTQISRASGVPPPTKGEPRFGKR